LSVTGAGRWVLEIKAPREEITQDTIDQAISYARHPEVSAIYAAILNGKRFVVMHNSQRSTDDPLIDLEVQSPHALAEQVGGFLSPAAIKRDCSPPIVDLGRPLAKGFRSNARIIGGSIMYSDFVWESNIDLTNESKSQLDEICRVMGGYRAAITGGLVWRDETSRLRARLDWSVPHNGLLEFVQHKKLMESEYVSLHPVISNDPGNPTPFDVVGEITVSEGERIYDILRWNTQVAGIETSMTYRGQAMGYIREAAFLGSFQAEYESSFPSLPIDLRVSMYGLGTFEVHLDTR
jgi:hypothetical protein